MKKSKILDNNNLHYATNKIEQYFSNNRVSWNQFYQSEKNIIENTEINELSDILDLGCACGGLGIALKEKFGVINYTGIELNPQAISTAKRINPNGVFINKDMLEISKEDLDDKLYDYVFSLSCIDWNIEFDKMFKKAFTFVKREGALIISLRLSKEKSSKDVKESFQYINYNNKKHGEVAPYVVININEFFNIIEEHLNVIEVNGYGYWGKPSDTAVTPYKRICFAVFSIKKGLNKKEKPIYNLNLPNDYL